MKLFKGLTPNDFGFKSAPSSPAKAAKSNTDSHQCRPLPARRRSPVGLQGLWGPRGLSGEQTQGQRHLFFLLLDEIHLNYGPILLLLVCGSTWLRHTEPASLPQPPFITTVTAPVQLIAAVWTVCVTV